MCLIVLQSSHAMVMPLPPPLCRNLHLQPLQLRRQLDLAGQPAVGAAFVGDKIQHLQLGRLGRGQQRQLRQVDIAMAGAASAATAAFGEKAVDAVFFSGLQQGLADSGFGVVLAAVGLDEVEQGHGDKF